VLRDAQGPEQVADRVRGEDGAALGRAESLGIEAPGDLRESASGPGQFTRPGGQLRVVAELGQAGHGAGDLRGGAVPAGPGDLHVDLLAGPGHGDADLLDQVADELLAVGVGGGGSVPDRGQVGGQRPDLVAFGGGQRPGAGGGEPVVLLAEALPLGWRGLPVLLQLPDDQAVFRLGELVLAPGPAGGEIGAFQPLPRRSRGNALCMFSQAASAETLPIRFCRWSRMLRTSCAAGRWPGRVVGVMVQKRLWIGAIQGDFQGRQP
jgi:hypothetical protein